MLHAALLDLLERELRSKRAPASHLSLLLSRARAGSDEDPLPQELVPQPGDSAETRARKDWEA